MIESLFEVLDPNIIKETNISSSLIYTYKQNRKDSLKNYGSLVALVPLSRPLDSLVSEVGWSVFAI